MEAIDTGSDDSANTIASAVDAMNGGESHDETCDDWFERFDAYQRALDKYGTRSQWRTWISPRIGTKCWRDIGPDDIEDIRDTLDDAILRWRAHGPGRGRLAGQTAMGVWWALRGAIREATSSKRRDLRVRGGMPNPAIDVLPPGDRRSRRERTKPFIYPREFARLVGTPEVPVVWRTVHSIAAYSYLRPSELRALRWSDVDLAHGLIRVARTWSYLDKKTRAPKTRGGIRDVPIHNALMPVLRRLHRQARSPLVLPVLGSVPLETLAARTRRHLADAGILRDALHASSLTARRATFRSWRESGITWAAMSGLDAAKIMRRAGHDDMATTMRYVKDAEDVAGDLGMPFGVLPRELGTC